MPQFLKDYIRAFRHKKILKSIEIPKNGIILDISCSDGKFFNRLHKLSPNLKLFGIDISSDDIIKAKADFPFANFSHGSADKLSFENNTFDFAFSIMSLHHYQNSNDFLKETYRVLKPKGILYLIDLIPKYTWTQKIHNWKGCPEPYHFEKFYSVKDLEKKLKPLGFSFVEDRKISLIPRVRLLKIQKL